MIQGDSDLLDREVKRVVKAVADNDLMRCIRVRSDADTLHLEATDGKVGIRCTLGTTDRKKVQVQNDLDVLLPGKIFSQVLGKLSRGTVTFENRSNQMKVTCGNAEFDLNLIHGEFPPFPDRFPEKTFHLNGRKLKSMIKQTLFASKDASQVTMKSVCMGLEKGQLSLTASDGSRISIRTEHVEISDIAFENLIIPAESIKLLYDLLDENDPEVRIAVGKNKIFVWMDESSTLFSATLVCDKYPMDRIKQVIPTEFKTVLKANAQEFARTLSSAMLIAVEEINSAVAMNLRSGTPVELITDVKEVGTFKDTLWDSTVEGEELDLLIHGKNLLDALQQRSEGTEEIVIQFSHELGPIFVRWIGCDNWKYILMPVRRFS